MSQLSDRLDKAEADAREADQVRKLAAAAAKAHEHELVQERETVARLERELGIAAKIGHTPVPKWLTKPGAKRTRRYRATPWLLLSDLHLDEVVDPRQLMGINAYNRAIAERRLTKTFEHTVEICHEFWTGIEYDGIVVALAGDNFSGNIHDELRETNEDTMLGSLDHWIGRLASGLVFLADAFGKVHVPVVVGNHGRTTRKPRHKFRARDNFDWFLGKALQRVLAHDDRITFDVSDSADLVVRTYERRVMLTHGDQASGGAGIGGIYPPIMRLDARKKQRQAAVGQPYDLLAMGHWHQLLFGPQFIINGSLKGYDEFAFDNNFNPEPPQQGLWLMTPEHGMTWTAPVLSQDRRCEGW